MSAKHQVVMEEDKESDTEEEIDSSNASNNRVEHSRGKIIFGEAPESDEENFAQSPESVTSISSAISALSAPSISEKKKSSKKYQSILVKKLYEKNALLHKNIREFVEQIATNAGNELNATNKRLLKCQVQMQEGANHLRILNSNLTSLDAYLQMLLSTNYLPGIKIVENTEPSIVS